MRGGLIEKDFDNFAYSDNVRWHVTCVGCRT